MQTVDHPTPVGEPEGAPASALPPDPARTVVDIAIPVYNEASALEASVARLSEYLELAFPFAWQITIVDNASDDATWSVAQALEHALPRVRALHLDRQGRGLALRHAWEASDADVVAYMDVDLSTDLAALLPLVAPLISGHSDVAIGSRLAPGARVARGPKRELISRAYNLLLRSALATRVRDAQCGFKAVRSDVARRLLPAVHDDGWFFDTELLLLAERNGLRIHEVPVDWVDDADSRVDIARTAIGDLRGTIRMGRSFASGRGRLDLGSLARPALADDLGRWLVSFVTIGVLSTLASLSLFLVLRSPFGAVVANVAAVSATFVANTWANTRFTARTRRPDWRGAFLVYLGALVLTSVALAAVHAAGGGRGAELGALAATWALAACARLLLVRSISTRGAS